LKLLVQRFALFQSEEMQQRHEDQRPEQRRSRLLGRIIRQLLDGEDFDTLADLTDALKFRCARLHIRITPDEINNAYQALTHAGVALVTDALPRRRTPHIDRDPATTEGR
jgi:hypothetical protein